jgi:hypothetical protein
MVATLPPAGPFGQSANACFLLVGLFGDLLLIRLFLTLAYIFLLIGECTAMVLPEVLARVRFEVLCICHGRGHKWVKAQARATPHAGNSHLPLSSARHPLSMAGLCRYAPGLQHMSAPRI